MCSESICTTISRKTTWYQFLISTRTPPEPNNYSKNHWKQHSGLRTTQRLGCASHWHEDLSELQRMPHKKNQSWDSPGVGTMRGLVQEKCTENSGMLSMFLCSSRDCLILWVVHWLCRTGSVPKHFRGQIVEAYCSNIINRYIYIYVYHIATNSLPAVDEDTWLLDGESENNSMNFYVILVSLDLQGPAGDPTTGTSSFWFQYQEWCLKRKVWYQWPTNS